MKKSSLTEDLVYGEAKPSVNVLLETDNSKEIRIAFKEGQIMKEHKTPFPIIVEIFEGEIEFGVEGTIHKLLMGDIVALEGGVPHDLKARSDSIVRLSLNKSDSAKRVKDVASKD